MIKLMTAVALALALNLSALCSAEQPDKAPSEVLAAWQALRAALLAEDAEAVGAVANFPLKSLDYGYDKVESAAALKKQFARLFDPKLLEIIKNDEISIAQGDPGYEVDIGNGYMIFGFEQRDGEYRLTYLGSINE